MFDIGWTELVIIGVVALIVIGPRDLPEMFRTLGRVTAKLRSMARDFQRAMETAANESGVRDVAKDLKSATSSKGLGIDAVRDAASKFEKWDPLKPAAPKPAAAKPVVAVGPDVTVPDPVVSAAQTIAAPAAMGPATAALAEKVAARKAIAADAAAKLRAVTAGETAPVPVAESKATRAKPVTKPATKPAPKPAADAVAGPSVKRGGRVRTSTSKAEKTKAGKA